MLGKFGQFGGERPRAAPDIKHPRARARHLPHEQPVIVGIVVPVQQPMPPSCRSRARRMLKPPAPGLSADWQKRPRRPLTGIEGVQPFLLPARGAGERHESGLHRPAEGRTSGMPR